MRSNSSAGHSGIPAATSVMPPISLSGSRAGDTTQRAERLDLGDEVAQIAVHGGGSAVRMLL